MLTTRIVPMVAGTPALLGALRRQLEGRLRRRLLDDDWKHILGGWHAVVSEGERLLSHMDELRSRFVLGALSTDRQPCYERLGWERWQGPTFVPEGITLPRTTEEIDGIMVLRRGSVATSTCVRRPPARRAPATTGDRGVGQDPLRRVCSPLWPAA